MSSGTEVHVGKNFVSGTKLGPYTIAQLVGRGGMGEVYEAMEHRLRRRVALKVIAPQNAGQHDEVDLLRRFIHEAHTLAQINHPNVVTVYSIDEDAGTQFIAMEYVEGSSFKRILSLISLSADEAAPLFLQMLEGLHALHEAQIIHRDLKPNNLMIRADGGVKVLDFGIAKRLGDQDQPKENQTSPGVLVGTLAYLAPEILTGTRANVRSDLWSLGAIFYEALTGQTLISLNTRSVRGARAYSGCDVIFPENTLDWIPEEMRIIVGKMCDGRPRHRYEDTNEAIADLKRFMQNRPPLPVEFNKSFTHLLRTIETMQGKDNPSEGDDLTEKRSLAVNLMRQAAFGTGATYARESSIKPRIDATVITEAHLDSIQLRSARRRKSRRNYNFKSSTVLWASLAASAAIILLPTKRFLHGSSSRPAIPLSPTTDDMLPPPAKSRFCPLQEKWLLRRPCVRNLQERPHRFRRQIFLRRFI